MKPRELLRNGESGIGEPPIPTNDANDTRIQIEWLETQPQFQDAVAFKVKMATPTSRKERMWHGC